MMLPTRATCDLVVAGGGIHGVGVAQAAAAAGWSVLLLEPHALAHGTSSRSSKLIHGGLRYLEHAHLGLVAESLRERAILLRIAPELVRLRPFHIPLYRHSRRPPWQIAVGLSLYTLLARFDPAARWQRLPPAAWEGLDGLATRGLVALFRYREAATDDAALVRAVMASAIALGAESRVGWECRGVEATGEGCLVHCGGGGGERTVTAGAFVNAAGPWAMALQQRITPAPPLPPVELVQGSHLVVGDHPLTASWYLESPRDGRPVFALPWRGGMLLGTTETPYRGDPGGVVPLTGERAYLGEVAAAHFPALAGVDWQALPAFAGLRVLPGGRGFLGARSRETRLVGGEGGHPRVVTVLGGKLTTYRATAQRVVERLRRVLPERAPRGDTRRLPLTPAE